jgi:putative membrane-bound dehydrogenase-like protein
MNLIAIHRSVVSVTVGLVCALGMGSWNNPLQGAAPPPDVVPHAGLTAEEAVKAATLPPGFAMHLSAAEPDVRQPIAFCIDHRGRLWVAEGHCYPKRRAEGEGLDRILILEDTTGDHRLDRRTVFMEGLNLVSGLEVGHGGVWIGAAPYLMFVPVTDWDDPRPASEPRILLDGWDYIHDTHETLNTFAWGPDGWLYGCHGVFCPSLVGKPGAPESQRQWVDAAVWRYHPIRHEFEVFAEGTSNPWGIDFDERGQCWIEACVIPHLWHMIQGGRYQRQGGAHYSINLEETARNERHRDANSRKPVFPHVYDNLKTVADHVHWAGDLGPHAANARSDAAGGGHAHAGMMVYLGDSWPEEYRGMLFMGNIHGYRLNMDIPERRGSGFVGRHGADFLFFNDRWSQTLNQLYDQDGSMYIIDWYDENQCHHNRIDGHDRSNGRIYKVVYGDTPLSRVDLQRLDDDALVRLLFHRNDWYPRHAQRILQERAQQGRLQVSARQQIEAALLGTPQQFPSGLPAGHRDGASEPVQLRLLWALHVTGGLTEAQGLRLLNRPEEYVRAWTIQLLCEEGRPSNTVLDSFLQLARHDESPVVRLYLHAALQRLPIEDRWALFATLARRGEDAGDHNIPLMAWYGGEPLAASDPERALTLALEARLPRLLEFTTRRIALVEGERPRDLIGRTLADVNDPAQQRAMLEGLAAALRGERTAPMPEGWDRVETRLAASEAPEVRALVLSLSLKFGSERALRTLRETLRDREAGRELRQAAMDALLAIRDPELPGVLQGLLADPGLRRSALRGLAGYDDERTAEAVLAVYETLQGPERREALGTLISRPAYALALLEAMEQGEVPARDLSADLLRQLRNLKHEEVNRRIEVVWGEYRESDPDAQREIERLKRLYWAGGSQPGDATRGRGMYVQLCQQCHTLYGVGGKLGPDITGANRGDLDYLLQKIVDPNAVIPNEYRASNLETRDGRVITGIVQQQDDRAVTIATADETLVVPRDEIDFLEESALSMMPEGLLEPLSDQEFRDLLYYLTRPGQAPLLATAQTLGPLFNGRDLGGWSGDPTLWRYENGEVIGRTDTALSGGEYIMHDVLFGDFRLVFRVRVAPNGAGGGLQFRSRRHGELEMQGYQVGIGAGRWGQLREDHGRGLLWNRVADEQARAGDWNLYEIVAVGGRIKVALNGKPCVDFDDPEGASIGILGLRLESNGPAEIRFRDFEVELDPEWTLRTVN